MTLNNKVIWGEVPLTISEIKHIKIADLNVHVHLLRDEIQIAYNYSKKEPSPKQDLLKDLDWHRWPVSSNKSILEIYPVLPNRPLLVKPESSLNLTADSETKIYFRFPVFIKLSLSSANKSASLLEIATIELSNTWFGNFKEGEICYSIRSGIRTKIEPDINRPFMAICSLKLKNRTKESFLIDKVCIHSNYLSLFLYENLIWTDEIAVNYTGKNEISQINFSGKEPSHLKGAIHITKPRETVKKSLHAHSFSTIKDLYGSGLFAGK